MTLQRDWRACVAAPLVGAAALFWATAGMMAPAGAQDFAPIAADDARLIIDPSAFESHDIRRSAADDGFIRYELWTSPFSTNRRFFHILLRDVLRGSPLMVYASSLERLEDFAAGGSPVRHELFGRTVERDVRTGFV